MKLSYLIKNVQKTERNSSYVDSTALFENFNLGSHYVDDSEEFQERMKSYWLKSWCCTDAHVGLRVYFFDDVAFAVSWQNARKNDEQFTFISHEMYDKVRQFLLTQLPQNIKPSFINPDEEEMGDTTTITYSGQLLDKEGFYQDRKCSVVARFSDYDSIDKWGNVVVRFEDGTEQEIDMQEFQIPWRINDVQV
ncbi:hypothetical protein [Caulobacter phage Cr30]|uniref:hypothetical protein n=1 Tax=Caulobacter phage Cr30 TaxID=1357714 RepID=UPI0004A9B9A9|nr:hypothetical protein OZ74_gp040 [Caulobacter phage Cr30]AGS80925.1 hypothetical protein [Caulobacter phage Cr30]